MLYGDLYRPVDYGAIARNSGGNLLAVYPYTEGLATIGSPNIGLDPTGHRVAVYAKDQPGLGLTHVDAGFGLFEPGVLDLLPEGRSSFEARVFPALAASGDLGAVLVDRQFFDIGNPSDLADARHRLATLIED
jgi:NDP-sugar pyrophosphorylase family protein